MKRLLLMLSILTIVGFLAATTLRPPVQAGPPAVPSVTTLLYFPFMAKYSTPTLNKILVTCGGYYLGIINPDGSGLTLVTPNVPTDPEEPAWSPDGSKIAFRGTVPGFSIYVMNADGSGVRPLTNLPGDYNSPTWSPDGLRIVFSSTLANPSTSMRDIYLMNADGSGTPLNLTNSPMVNETSPDWSPDGTKIAYTSRPSGVNVYQIYVMNADGSGQTNLAVSGDDPNWSPDSRKIAYRALGAVWGIAVMNADGSGQMQLTDSDSDGNPNWSPDGGKIAYGFYYRIPSLWTMNADGTGKLWIAVGCGDPDWR